MGNSPDRGFHYAFGVPDFPGTFLGRAFPTNRCVVLSGRFGQNWRDPLRRPTRNGNLVLPGMRFQPDAIRGQRAKRPNQNVCHGYRTSSNHTHIHRHCFTYARKWRCRREDRERFLTINFHTNPHHATVFPEWSSRNRSSTYLRIGHWCLWRR